MKTKNNITLHEARATIEIQNAIQCAISEGGGDWSKVDESYKCNCPDPFEWNVDKVLKQYVMVLLEREKNAIKNNNSTN